MGFNFGILLIISFPCVLLNSPLALCHRTLPPTPAPASQISDAPTSQISDGPTSQISDAPTSSPPSFISEPPSSSPSFDAEAPASSPTASWAPESSPTASWAPESSPTTPTTPPSTPSADGNDQFAGFGSMDAGMVKKLCEMTENPTLCANSILPFLKGPASWASALETEINSFLSLSEKAIARIKAAMNHPSTTKSTAESLQVCLDIYGAAGDDLKQAKEAVKANDMGLLASMLSGAITDLGTCEDAFNESGDESPLDNNLVATMHKLADNCFDISSAMHA